MSSLILKSQKASKTYDTSILPLVTLFKVLMEDGKTHIRVDNRGLTKLGRMLDSQYFSPFHHPDLGDFNTTEGFFFYIMLENPSELLRVQTGHEVRKFVREQKARGEGKKKSIKNFYQHVKYANFLKISSNPSLKQMLINNDLPLQMHYVETGTFALKNIPTSNPRLANLIDLQHAFKANPDYCMEKPDIKSLGDFNTTISI